MQGTAHDIAEGVPEVAETASRQVEQLASGLEKELPKVRAAPLACCSPCERLPMRALTTDRSPGRLTYLPTLLLYTPGPEPSIRTSTSNVSSHRHKACDGSYVGQRLCRRCRGMVYHGRTAAADCPSIVNVNPAWARRLRGVVEYVYCASTGGG